MGLFSWVRGEPSVGDRDYETYQRVEQQLRQPEETRKQERHNEVTRTNAELTKETK